MSEFSSSTSTCYRETQLLIIRILLFLVTYIFTGAPRQRLSLWPTSLPLSSTTHCPGPNTLFFMGIYVSCNKETQLLLNQIFKFQVSAYFKCLRNSLWLAHYFDLPLDRPLDCFFPVTSSGRLFDDDDVDFGLLLVKQSAFLSEPGIFRLAIPLHCRLHDEVFELGHE